MKLKSLKVIGLVLMLAVVANTSYAQKGKAKPGGGAKKTTGGGGSASPFGGGGASTSQPPAKTGSNANPFGGGGASTSQPPAKAGGSANPFGGGGASQPPAGGKTSDPFSSSSSQAGGGSANPFGGGGAAGSQPPKKTGGSINGNLPITVMKSTGSGNPLTDTFKVPERNPSAVISNAKDRIPLVYDDIREDDAIYRHKLWKIIDAREKINAPFVYRG